MIRLALASALLLGLVACGGSDDDASSNVSDLEAGRGALTRTITEALPVPTSPFIGAKIADVQAAATAKAGATKRSADCTTTSYVGETSYQLLDCKTSTTIRFLNADGTVREEHADLDKDGLVDRYTASSGKVAQYTDANFDGKIDVEIERVSELTDFSLDGYNESFPQSDFLYRIREDRNRDGALDFETLTARGALPDRT